MLKCRGWVIDKLQCIDFLQRGRHHARCQIESTGEESLMCHKSAASLYRRYWTRANSAITTTTSLVGSPHGLDGPRCKRRRCPRSTCTVSTFATNLKNASALLRGARLHSRACLSTLLRRKRRYELRAATFCVTPAASVQTSAFCTLVPSWRYHVAAHR